MSKLVIMGTVEVAPGTRDRVLPLLMAHKARCLRDEPGTLQFEVVLPRENDSRMLIYEVYQDDAAFDDTPAWASRFSQHGARPSSSSRCIGLSGRKP